MFTRRQFVATGATAVLATAGLAACSDDDSSGGSDNVFTWWDPYPQHEADSDWEERVQSAGKAAGVTIERTAYDTTALTNQALLAAQEGNSPDIILLDNQALTNQALLAAQEGNSPDIILLDNPALPTLADTGMLSTTEELGLDVSHVDENLLASAQIDGDTFGIPIGANTLALYYNLEVLDEAGVDPESITDWDSLTEALGAISETGNRGITFAGINTEEGTFQFLPWFWGNGAELTDLSSPAAIEEIGRASCREGAQ